MPKKRSELLPAKPRNSGLNRKKDKGDKSNKSVCRTLAPEDDERSTMTMAALVPEDETAKITDQQPCYANFLATTLKKGVKGLVEDFRAEKRGNDLTRMTVFAQERNKPRNRYKDVGCLDDTRVFLTLGNNDYIHANFVFRRKFICAQAPLDGTIVDFWHMIVQEKVAFVLMLCNLKEQGASKCAEYYPTSVAHSLQLDGVTVSVRRSYRYKMTNETKVTIWVTEMDVTVAALPGKMHRCVHMHWRDWPDRGTPPADMTPVELCEMLTSKFKKSGKPIVVHCSAGIGRTGSIVLIDLLLEMLQKNKVLDADIRGYMAALRKQRNNSVQTKHQYLYIHMVMLNYIKTRYSLNGPDTLKKLSKFMVDYSSYTKGF